MTLFLIVVVNFILYWYTRVVLIKKFRNSYSITLKDKEGNTQTLADTIAYLIEQNSVQEKRIMYLAKEMESQWCDIELIKDTINLPDTSNADPLSKFRNEN